MKLYEQIGDLLALASDFHGKMAQFYVELTDEVEKERVALLLEYLSRHEKRLQKSLSQYRPEEPQNYGGTWLQYIPGDDQLMLDDLAPSPDMTVDDLVGMVIEMENRLLNFYEAVAESVSLPPGAQDIFKQLAQQEHQEKTRLVRAVERSKHM